MSSAFVKTKVIHTTAWLSERGGGIPPVIWGYSREMRKMGVDCAVAGLGDNSVKKEDQNGGVVFLNKGRGAFGYSPEMRCRLSSWVTAKSVVHNHGLWMHHGVLARKRALATGAPLVISAHGMLDAWALQNSLWKKRLAGWVFENRNLNAANCLHALCEAEAKSYRDYGLRNPICIIPNGVDLPEIGDRRSEIGNPPWKGIIEPGQKILLYLGRIHPKKGLSNLIKAWAELKTNRKSEIGNRKSEWVLAIAGWDQGGHEAELKRLCDEVAIAWGDVRTGETTGQPENVTTRPGSVVSGQWSVVFLGPQFGEAKAACYANCDGFVLPSFSEGLPMAVLEAWAYSKPVLMTEECNLPEGFASGAAKRTKTDVQSIADSLCGFFKISESDRRKMGQAGRDLVSERFAWPNIASQMIQVYQWLLGSGVKPTCVVQSSIAKT